MARIIPMTLELSPRLSWAVVAGGLAACLPFACFPSSAEALPRLKVSEDRHFLVTDSGEPFFWLGDTAWELFHRLSREDAERYLDNRARKGFTVIQAVVLAEFAGLTDTNAYGQRPLNGNDLTQPNEGYFRHVDWIVAKANSLGLYIGMLPTWGDKWNKKWGAGPEIFTPQNAETLWRVAGPAIQRCRHHLDFGRRPARGK